MNRTAFGRRLCYQTTHRVYNYCSCAAVDATTQWHEKTRSTRPAQVVPKPAGRSKTPNAKITQERNAGEYALYVRYFLLRRMEPNLEIPGGPHIR